MNKRFSSCWVVTDGKAGMESQCVGLAEGLGIQPEIKRVRMRAPWRMLSPWLRLGLGHAFENMSMPEPPWPDLLIASGRLSIPASLFVREQSELAGKRTFTVQIQNPVISPSNFDLVIAPLHDSLEGPNVISTIGAPHRVEPDRLSARRRNPCAALGRTAAPLYPCTGRRTECFVPDGRTGDYSVRIRSPVACRRHGGKPSCHPFTAHGR